MAVRVSKTDFEEKVLKEKLPVLVDFYSDSCVACKKLAPVLGNAEDDYEDKIKVYKVNTNFDVELAEQYEVQANPTLILFKDGQLFPGNILTGLMWENACGMKKVGDMYSIVTSGVGLWGPPMRIGTKAEVVIIDYGK